MIITGECKVVVAVGEPIAYDGKVWRCVRDVDTAPNTCKNHCAFYDPFLKPLCHIMECRYSERPDGLAVHFVPFGEEERI